MGNQKQKWRAEEEEALLKGVAKHGHGKWKNILKDPEFAPFLTLRSNIDLKDKWRNLSVSNAAAQGCKEKSRGSTKAKILALTLPSGVTTQNSTPSDGLVADESLNTVADGQNGSRYNAWIFEALSTIRDANGCDISAIVHFIEQRYEVPHNFRRLLGSRLRRLASQGKLEKVQNGYRISKGAALGTKTPTPKQKDVRPQNSRFSETVEEAAIAAAYKVAEAENKSFLAAEAVKEAERVSKMAEDADTMLQLVIEIYERCSQGEIILWA